ncbi:MAG: ImmA/IrrE family metallo-endopeptidase [Alphaproteobacteria bacterium]|nr:MAG: ImmA/IrrE family metallo-endopeptidase [Alphaproteobacteria bacterium]
MDKAYFYAQTAHAIPQPMIANFIKYPVPDLPSIPTTHCETPFEARRAGAEAARALRSMWGIGWGPISNLIRLIESKGIRVFYVRESVEQLDGFACWTGGKPYMFLNQKLEDPARESLNAAHELGHLVMHRDIALDAHTDFYESMAFGFAAEFLAPWETFKKEAPVIPDLNHLGRLKTRWRISMQAMVKHMHSNGAISDAAYQNAFRRFNVLGYRRGPEPGWLVPDHSVIHTKFVEMVEKKGLSLPNVAEDAGMSDRLLGVPASSATFGKDSPFFSTISTNLV